MTCRVGCQKLEASDLSGVIPKGVYCYCAYLLLVSCMILDLSYSNKSQVLFIMAKKDILHEQKLNQMVKNT